MQTDIELFEVVLYAIAWFLAAVCGMLSTRLFRSDYIDSGDMVAIGCVSGFVGLSCTLLISWSGGSDWRLWILASIACGLMGKRSIRLIYAFQYVVFSRFGIPTLRELSRSEDERFVENDPDSRTDHGRSDGDRNGVPD